MSVEVAAAVAENLATAPHSVTVLWHGGEPLATGRDNFRELLSPFRELRTAGRIRHSLQTNGTLIDDQWCELFKQEGFRVGISLDGYAEQNAARVNWAGRSTFAAALRGIAKLQRHGIEFGVIAVVNENNIEDPEGFYEFFVQVGCNQLNINVEEQEGLNRDAAGLRDMKVRQFWDRLYRAWRRSPRLRVREFDTVLGWMNTVAGTGLGSAVPRQPNMWPTVSATGDVVVISPELMAATAAELQRFVVGNVLTDPLDRIVSDALSCEYVQEAMAGFRNCRATCPYFSYCGGGDASNKYYELGRLDGTETAHCRHTRKAVVDSVIEALNISAVEANTSF